MRTSGIPVTTELTKVYVKNGVDIHKVEDHGYCQELGALSAHRCRPVKLEKPGLSSDGLERHIVATITVSVVRRS